MRYEPGASALLLVDPFNDFLCEGGKLWDEVAELATEVNLVVHLECILMAARSAGLAVVFVPHHRAAPDDYQGWRQLSTVQERTRAMQAFARESWGGQYHQRLLPQAGDVIASEHFGSSGFASTDLDLLLKQRGVRDVILTGMAAHTCVESTGRHASELGYHVTLVTDATAAFSREQMHCAHAVSGPTYAHRIVDTAQLLRDLSNSAAR
jgi:nicotinamidase-related amidase